MTCGLVRSLTCLRSGLFAALCVAGATRLAAQPGPSQATPAAGIIDGIVSNGELVPLDDATILVLDAGARVVTGPNGRFRIYAVRPGPHVLLVRRIGFEAATATVDVVAADTARIAVSLEPTVTTLDAARITGVSASPKLAEFESRRRFEQGQYITREQIDARNSVRVGGLLEGLRGLQVVPTSTIGGGEVAANRRGRGGSLCPFTIFVDGIPAGTTNLDLLPSPKEIAAIEVYSSSALIPVQYKRPGVGFCGLILIWMRDGP